MPGLQAFDGEHRPAAGNSVRKPFSERDPRPRRRRSESGRPLGPAGRFTGRAGPADLSGIVAVVKPNVDPEPDGPTAPRPRGRRLPVAADRLRFSPHVYTNADDLDRLAARLCRLLEVDPTRRAGQSN